MSALDKIDRKNRSYDSLLMLLTMAGVPWEEACRLAREFADKSRLVQRPVAESCA